MAKLQWWNTHTEGFLDRLELSAGDAQNSVSSGAPALPVAPLREANDAVPAPMAEILLAMSISKGIFFTGLQLYELIEANPSMVSRSACRIHRDTTLHSDFAAYLYSSLDNKIDKTVS